ncbi:hypothetical protein HY969_02870 [Candidatus Kaiserbacteria bacterium]|nr:hypothetical protein [Candidatus Kaiserbacteria bacterium]
MEGVCNLFKSHGLVEPVISAISVAEHPVVHANEVSSHIEIDKDRTFRVVATANGRHLMPNLSPVSRTGIS